MLVSDENRDEKEFERRLEHHRRNNWDDPLAMNDPNWRIRYEFYRHHNWSDEKALLDEDPVIIEAYKRHNKFESDYG